MNKDMSKNLKDIEESPQKDMPSVLTPYKAGGFGSYTKTHKLITALYMVTDIMDKDEPIRNKLRILGIEIISDPERIRPEVGSYGAGMSMRIEQIVSFLNIAGAMNFISEMNCTILKKEFLGLKSSLQESMDVKPKWLEEFLSEGIPPILNKEEKEGRFLNSPHPNPLLIKERRNLISKGHTRLGVQKGSTLLKAIKDMSNRVLAPYDPTSGRIRSGFDILKKERRQEITNFIIKNGGSATITDIKNGAKGSLASCSEKTLQRELMSMTKDGALNKTGEKRWSRYLVK